MEQDPRMISHRHHTQYANCVLELSLYVHLELFRIECHQ